MKKIYIFTHVVTISDTLYFLCQSVFPTSVILPSAWRSSLTFLWGLIIPYVLGKTLGFYPMPQQLWSFPDWLLLVFCEYQVLLPLIPLEASSHSLR